MGPKEEVLFIHREGQHRLRFGEHHTTRFFIPGDQIIKDGPAKESGFRISQVGYVMHRKEHSRSDRPKLDYLLLIV